MTKLEATRAIIAICTAIVETVKESPGGAPATSIYLACMEFGCTLVQFEQVMSALVEAGRLRQEGHLYYFAGEP